MSRSREELIDWVQSRIDEIGIADQQSTIDPSIISFEIDEAANNLLRSAERNIVYPLASAIIPTFCLVRPMVPAGMNSIIIPIQSSLIRHLRTQLYSWNVHRDILSSVESDDYLKQNNPSERSTVNRPTIALIPFVFSYSDGSATVSYSQALECFPGPASLTSGYRTTPALGNTAENNIAAAAIAEGLSVIFESGLESGQHKEIRSLLVISRKVAENLPEDLHSPMVWLTAAQLLTSLRESAASDKCLKHAEIELKQLSVSKMGQ
jgi:hypothetical protein